MSAKNFDKFLAFQVPFFLFGDFICTNCLDVSLLVNNLSET